MEYYWRRSHGGYTTAAAAVCSLAQQQQQQQQQPLETSFSSSGIPISEDTSSSSDSSDLSLVAREVDPTASYSVLLLLRESSSSNNNRRIPTMWSKFLLGGGGGDVIPGAAAAKQEEEQEEEQGQEDERLLNNTDDDDDDDDNINNISSQSGGGGNNILHNNDNASSADDSTTDLGGGGGGGGLLGNRFSYVGRMATRLFIEQVVVTTTSEEDNRNNDERFLGDDADFLDALHDDDDDAGWNEEDDPLDNLTDEQKEDDPMVVHATTEDETTTTTTVPTTVAPSAASLRIEESFETANASMDDSAAFVDEDDHHQVDEVIGATPDATTPELVETGLETSEREVAGRLDTLLQQIAEQENPAAAAAGTAATNASDDDGDDDDNDGVTSSDEEHRDQAVHQIQQELEQVAAVLMMSAAAATTPKTTTPNKKTATPPVVDLTPRDHHDFLEHSVHPSLATLAESEDLTRDTGYVAAAGDGNESLLQDDDEDVYEFENEHAYGPVVDHTPTKPVPLQRADSLAVQAGQLDREIREDAAMSVSDSGWKDDDDGGGTISDADDDTVYRHQLEELKILAIITEPNVVDHTPALEEDDVTRRESAFSIGVLASLGDTVDVAPDDGKEMDETHEFGPVVDVTPPTPAPESTVAESNASLVVNATEIEVDFEEDEAMDFTCYGDSTVGGIMTDGAEDDGDGSHGDGWASDDDEALAGIDDDDDDRKMPPLVSMVPKRATFSPTLTTFESHLVDHTPSELPDSASAAVNRHDRDPSIIALAMSEDETRDTGLGLDEEVYDDENEHEYGLVVDHTPQTPLSSILGSGTNSLAVHAFALKQDIEEDEAMDDTSYNGSTLGDGETDVAGGGADDWGEDDEEDRKLPARETSMGRVVGDVALVDHTPSEIDSPTKYINGGPSVDVLASIANTVDTGEADSTGEANVVYGPVVDQTPTTPAPSVFLARSDSVLVQGNDDVDSDDETTVVGGSRVGCGDDTVGEELPVELEPEDQDQVVDFIPPRFESRHGDASTLVAADPSEVMSEVDDLAPEEQNFGPVVDLTPPTHEGAAVFELPSGEGSTFVFAPPSVAADDLDAEDEGDAGAEQEGWDNEDPVVEEEPNPQSGNEDPVVVNRVTEQLVDFLPPPNDDDAPEVGDAAREALSEITVGGAQSMLHGGDPVEDDFGPVVDQLPSAARSHASSSTQLSASECRAMEKDDHVNEGDDASSVQAKAKVVVDHLPIMDRKRPVDSTATLGRSQLSEEEEEEDASKFGPVVDHLPTSRASITPSRGGSTVDALAAVSEVNSDDEEGDAWDDDADFDASLGGVSESTGRHDVTTMPARQISQLTANTPSIDTDRSVRFVNDSRSTGESACASQSRPHALDPDIGTAVPDEAQYYDPELLSVSETQYFDPEQGQDIGWDDALAMHDSSTRFHDARRNEMTDKSFAEADTPPSTPYRRPEPLVEKKEMNGADISLPLLSLSQCDKCSSAQTVDCPCVQRLLAINSENGSVVGSMITPGGDTIKIDFTLLLQDEVSRRRLVEEELEALKARIGPQKLSESLVKAKEAELKTEIAEIELSRDEAVKKMLESQSDTANLREVNMRLIEELLTSRSSLTELEKSHAGVAAKQSAFEAEVHSLKQALCDSGAEETSTDDFQKKFASLQVQLASKTGECKELGTKVEQFELRLRAADKAFAEQSKEATELSILLKQSISSLKEQLSGSDSLVMTTEKARLELERKIQALDSEVNNLRSSSKQVAQIQIQHEKDLQQQYSLLDKKTSDIRTLEEQMSALQAEKAHIVADLAQQRALAEQSESLANELISVAKERDLLERALTESKEAMISLQHLIDEHGMERQALDSKRDLDNSSLKSDLQDVRRALALKENELADLASQMNFLTTENGDLEAKLHELREAYHAAESTAEAAKFAAANEERKTAQREKEIEALKQELEDVSNNHEKLASEVEEATVQLDDLSKVLKRVEEESTDRASRNTELEGEISRLKELSDCLVEERDTASSERDATAAQCDEMETKYASALSEFEQKVKELTTEYEDDLSKLKENSDQLRQEVARLNEAETHHAQTLEEVERNAQNESSRYEESTARFIAERDHLLQQVARLEETMVEQSRSLANVEDDAEAHLKNGKLREECEALREKVARYQELEESAARELQELEARMAEQFRQHTEDAANLNDQCDKLRLDLARSQALETEYTDALAELEDRSNATTAAYETELTRLQTECDELRAQKERHEAVAGEMRAERDRLGEVMRECDILGEENEEMLVQFGILNQQMEAAEDRARELQAEILVMRTAAPQNGALATAELEELRTKNAELNAQIQLAVTERDAADSGSKSETDALRVLIKELEGRTTELDHHVKERQEEIDRLMGGTADTSGQMHDIKTELHQKNAALARNEAEIQTLKDKIESLHESSDKKTRKVETLRKEIKEKEGESTKRVQELELLSKDLEVRLQLTKEQVKTTEAALEAKSQIMSLLKESEIQIRERETELAEKNATVLELERSVEELQNQVAGPTAASNNAVEFAALQQQIDVLNQALQSTRNRLVVKEEDVDRLAAEIRSLQSAKTNDVVTAATTASQELVRQASNLRDSVVARAAVLKRSDSIRAEAIHRLEAERQSNAEALRRLGESVKKYYSST